MCIRDSLNGALRRYLGAMQDEIGHGASLKVRGPLNEELLLLVKTGIEAIGFGWRPAPLLLPGSLDGLWHAMISNYYCTVNFRTGAKASGSWPLP